jgi:hypothetical protein
LSKPQGNTSVSVVQQQQPISKKTVNTIEPKAQTVNEHVNTAATRQTIRPQYPSFAQAPQTITVFGNLPLHGLTGK